MNTAGSFIFTQPVAGALSDHWGRRPVMSGFAGGGMLLTVPIMRSSAGRVIRGSPSCS